MSSWVIPSAASIFNENDADLDRKVMAALDAGFRPILCCGETDEEREAGQTETRSRAS